MTFLQAVQQARNALRAAGLQAETAARDADLLARHVKGWDPPTWLLRRGETSDQRFVAAYDAAIARRLTREPVAYIRGVQEFWGREFLVTPAVLIPRPETELLVESAGDYLRERPAATIVDVGTGSGCLAITLALEHPSATVVAVDVSAAALEIAQRNAKRLDATRVWFVEGAYLEPVESPIDLIVSNPPYVAERDRAALSPEVREHEPAVALFGGEDGWRHLRRLLHDARARLSPHGRLLVELGFGQSEQLARELDDVSGLQLVQLINDLQGIPRVAVIGPDKSMDTRL